MTTLSPRALPPLAALVLAAALTALLLGGLGAPPAARAQVDPATGDGLGSIAGTVVDENGTPLGGMQVDFYVYADIANAVLEWHSARAVRTDAAGHYLAALTPGTYRVRFSDPAGVYALQFYSGAMSVESAEDIVIAGTAKTAIDARLQAAGSISGVLHAEDLPFPLVEKVAAYAQVGGSWQIIQADYASDKSSYSLPGLPPGTYRVCRTQRILSSQILPCFNRIAGGIDSATDIAVAGGDHVGGIDLWTSGFADYATIKGKVTDRTGTGLTGIKVEALATEGTPYTFYTTTDNAGEYALQVVAHSEFAVEFTNRDGLYVSQPFSGTIELQPAEVHSGIDANLTLGGRITGTWGYDGGPRDLVAIDTMNFDQQYEAADRYAFDYRIGGLPVGVYRVCNRHWLGYAPYYAYSCYPDRAEYAAAANITVTAGSTVAGISYPTAAPAPPPTEGSVLTGIVHGPDGRALAGIDVALLQLWAGATGYSIESISAYVAHTTTDLDGVFRFEGVENGVYKARAFDPAGVYATTYYHSTPPWSSGDAIIVQDDQSPPPIAIELPLGGALSGWVQRAGGQPIGDAFVTLYEAHSSARLSEYWPVNGRGRFTISGLWPDVYLVCASSDRWPFNEERCYTTASEPYRDDGSPLVTVTVGVTTEDIAITLGPVPARPVFLPAVKR